MGAEYGIDVGKLRKQNKASRVVIQFNGKRKGHKAIVFELSVKRGGIDGMRPMVV